VTDSTGDDDGATAESDSETPRGAPKPDELDDRRADAETDDELPPETREEDDAYEDEYGEAREIANPDQHRDDEAYD
jgi:hypothetical protein